MTAISSNRIRVGVDARSLTVAMTGIARYTFELCRVMAERPELELYIYSPCEIDQGLRSRLSPCTFKQRNITSSIGAIFWGETWLPYWAAVDQVDVLWGPSHKLPFFCSSRIRTVLTIHDLVWLYYSETMRPGARALERFKMPFSVKRANHITTVSEASKSAILKEFRIKPESLTIVTPGRTSPNSLVGPQSLKDLGICKPFLLFVGTPEPRKNLYRLLQAYSNLAEELKSNYQLVIAGGGGWGGASLEISVQELKLTKFTRVLGYIPDTTLALLYKEAVFLVMPSLYEGFGLPILESLSHGTPVLTSHNSAMPEVCADAGLLVDPEDVASIEEGLKSLMTDDILLNSLSEKTSAAAARYDWNTSAERMVGICTSLAAR